MAPIKNLAGYLFFDLRCNSLGTHALPILCLNHRTEMPTQPAKSDPTESMLLPAIAAAAAIGERRSKVSARRTVA